MFRFGEYIFLGVVIIVTQILIVDERQQLNSNRGYDYRAQRIKWHTGIPRTSGEVRAKKRRADNAEDQ